MFQFCACLRETEKELTARPGRLLVASNARRSRTACGSADLAAFSDESHHPLYILPVSRSGCGHVSSFYLHPRLSRKTGNTTS